ncbi:universal stress protein family, putative [Synechococcus sp. PCC 7335]|uniref:universal stress protein n=1 Tax=Synechococcus sp. (strain ATCC 29403 / PCC 7335) TaxID=91464 RepID=UPI00017EE0E4|nr:universal stress protein [Synechococcus sp. PCC 7335]EDX84244.1 universal stress protein family, putative [Synechococcus sp. PCC 7335]
MINKILVALDTNESYEAVFQVALDMAKAESAELTLLSVLSTDGTGELPTMAYPSLAGYPFAVPEYAWDAYQKQYDMCKRRGYETLSKLEHRATKVGVRARVFQDVGDPGTLICNRAKTEKASLVVVGTHGRRGINELLIGSVSSYVMHRAPCSVLIVRAQTANTEAAESEAFTQDHKLTAA